MPCARTTVIPGSAAAAASFSTDNQYVHYSGNMFLLIPTQLQLCTGIQGIKAAAAAAAESEEEEEFLQVISGVVVIAPSRTYGVDEPNPLAGGVPHPKRSQTVL